MTKQFPLKTAMLGLLLITGLTACKTQKHGINSSSRDSGNGWISLFNGTDLEGWHTFHKQHPDPCWKAAEGAIVLDHSAGKGEGDLITDKVYANFILTAEWKISRGGNSGILIDVQEAPQYKATYFTGPEMQVLDNINASDNKKDNHLAGSLYDLIACDPAVVKPVGKWNHVKIKQYNGNLIFWMNGHKIIKIQMGTPEWNNLVSQSKFKKWKAFGAFQKGHIALQDHGHKVWYRNIRLKEL